MFGQQGNMSFLFIYLLWGTIGGFQTLNLTQSYPLSHSPLLLMTYKI